MIVPRLKDTAFLADVEAAPEPALWWLGQSGFLVKAAGARVLFDPYLSTSLERKYASTDKPHVRMSEIVVPPGDLRALDLVTSSHNHTDHLDAETLLPVFAANPDAVFAFPAPNRAFVEGRLGPLPVRSVGVEPGQKIATGNIELWSVPAAHEVLSPETVGYVVRVGGLAIYHSGDTLVCPELADALRGLEVDVALVPINGRIPERRVAGNMWGDEAARFCKEIGAKLAVPHHYDLFQFNTESPELFENTCREIGQAFRTLELGERLAI